MAVELPHSPGSTTTLDVAVPATGPLAAGAAGEVPTASSVTVTVAAKEAPTGAAGTPVTDDVIVGPPEAQLTAGDTSSPRGSPLTIHR